MSDPRIRQLKIKTGVVKRLTKEKVTYEKEAAQQRDKIEKLKVQSELINLFYSCVHRCFFCADKDGYDIKKQEEVLQESLMMVPDCQRRLVKAFVELKNIIDLELDLKEIEDYVEAEKILKEAEAQLPTEEDNIQTY